MRRALLALVVLLAARLFAPSALHAQGENAMPMPAGSFRISIGADWAHYDERFGTA